MNFHPRITDGLTPNEIQALSDAVDMVDDYLLDELTEKRNTDDETGGAAFSDRYLPERHRDLYDFATIRRLYACFVVVAGRLQDGWRPHACRAEELVTVAIIEQARLLYKEATGRESEALEFLYEPLFEDLDHQYMFDAAYDGIDDPGTFEGAQMRTGSLQPKDWFEPLWDGVPVHPLIAAG